MNNSFVDVPNLKFISYLGKYCCKSGCCDISKEMQDKGYVPALPPASSLNITVSMAQSKTLNSFCIGTECGEIYCIVNVFDGTCCPNPRYGCPSNTICCGDSYSETPWCCQKSQRCGLVKNQCLNNADSCDGTQCGDYCFEKDYGRTCCSDPQYSCPPNTRCCGGSFYENPWCCEKSQSCSPLTNMCINSAVTASIAKMSMLFAFVIGIASKYYL